MTARLLENAGRLADGDEPRRLEAIRELGRRADGTAIPDALAVLKLLDAGGGAPRLRDLLAEGRVDVAVALPRSPAQPLDHARLIHSRCPELVAVPRGTPGFDEEGRDGLVLELFPAAGAEPRGCGEGLSGTVWQVSVGGVAPRTTVDVGAEAIAVMAAVHVRHAAYLTGAAEALLEATRERVVSRRQFGVPISSFQAVAFDVAAHTARWRAVGAHVEALGEAPAEHPAEAARLLAGAGDLATQTALDLIVLHGAHGLTGGSPAQRLYRHLGQLAGRWGVPGALRDYAQRLDVR